jgi:hypothetical protein
MFFMETLQVTILFAQNYTNEIYPPFFKKLFFQTMLLRRFSTPEKFNVNKKERICTAVNIEFKFFEIDLI